MINFIKDLRSKTHPHVLGGLDILKYIGPGLLVTVGFIDPGNWASNFAAGSEFGYTLLWVVTLSTIMLIALQHNVAHLGIVTGLCLSEATEKYVPKYIGRPIIISAMLASISTSMAEILGGAIALQMLFGIPIIWGSILTVAAVMIMIFTNSYKRMERAIIGFVSIIGLSFIYELFLVHIDWAWPRMAGWCPVCSRVA
jgi:manganese transport protein